MSFNIKNTVISFVLVAVTIPFILVTDIFPFLRFGMFAEPVKSKIQKEVFLLSYTDNKGKEQIFDPHEVGIEPHFFYYLVRNYYYRNESTRLIENVEQIYSDKTIHNWKIKRVIISDIKEIPSDTTVVFSAQNE